MHHCRVSVLHVAGAAIALCTLLVILKSRAPTQPTALRHRARTVHAFAAGGDSDMTESSKQRRVWLYSLIGTDFPGAATLLQHWLRHYTDTGFRHEQMLLVVHSNSNGTTATGNLQDVTRVLQHAGIAFESWTGTPYSSDAHLEIKLQLMHDRIVSPDDWVVIADSDEFYDFDVLGPGIQGYVSRLEAANTSFGVGMLVDRVAEDGSLPDMQATPRLSEQFGLHCAVVRQLTLGFPWKVVAFKAYLRTNTGNHRVVTARTAAMYFGPAAPGTKTLRGGFQGASDVYGLTPYAAHPEKYVRTKQQPRAVGRLWSASLYPNAIAAMHFKWHSGVIQSATARLQHYRGNGSDDLPRYAHFVESERILAMLVNGSLPVKSAECSRKMPWRVRSPPKKKRMYI